MQGRFVLAFLFEYAATLGVVDVGYIAPQYARNDFRGRWGTDDLKCLSRYDGLMFVRINDLGAWCLGQTDNYGPAGIEAGSALKVLANRDVVASEGRLDPGDVLLLMRFGERTSDAVWRLDAGKILQAVEQGMKVQELREFLTARCLEPPPQPVAVFLDDVATRAGELEDLGTARIIACANAHVAQVLVNDRRLRARCQLAGDRQLIFRTADEAAVRRALRELGYALPPAGT